MKGCARHLLQKIIKSEAIELLLHHLLLGFLNQQISRIKAPQNIKEQTAAALQLSLAMLATGKVLMNESGDASDPTEFAACEFGVIQGGLKILIHAVRAQKTLRQIPFPLDRQGADDFQTIVIAGQGKGRGNNAADPIDKQHAETFMNRLAFEGEKKKMLTFAAACDFGKNLPRIGPDGNFFLHLTDSI